MKLARNAMQIAVAVLLCVSAASLLFWCLQKYSAAKTTKDLAGVGPGIAEAAVVTESGPAAMGGLLRPGTVALRDRGTGESKSLPPTPDVTWERAATEPAFSEFVEWTHRYIAAATVSEKAALETEGIALARERLDTLAE